LAAFGWHSKFGLLLGPGVVMNTGILRSPDKRVWRQFYKAALFELDTNKVSDRIAEAETALLHVRENCFTQRETISKKSRL
jgi:hypothetical protein